jgi:hypothetical protein
MFGTNLKSVDFYVQNGYEYFVISKLMKKDRITEFSAKQYPQAANFYLSLNTHPALELIKTIAPSDENKGDTFYVYAIHNSDSMNAKSENN